MAQRYRWKNKELREHIDVLDGRLRPTKILKNAVYLHSVLKKWVQAHIWIHQDRIIYCGDQLPETLDGCEVTDCSRYYLVPGYIEPHVHPFQLYNPHSFAHYASQTGTTTFINDNLMLFLLMNKKKAFSLLEDLKQLPFSMYWWARFDSQTEMQREETVFSHNEVKSWLNHEDVVQGGELTSWPRLLDGDDMILHLMQEAKRLNKVVEGHLPGASEKTLAKLALLGVDGDHEAMTGKDVYMRLMQGLAVTLRNSSIRPDLDKLLDEIKEYDIDNYGEMMLTTDGSTPGFYEGGVLDVLIAKAIDSGIPVIDAYHMASYNVARHYRISHHHGMIAAGRVANINFLESKEHPSPAGVMAKGEWAKNLQGVQAEVPSPDWGRYGLGPLKMQWDLTYDDLQFSMPFGIEMVNEVITKPYSVGIDASEIALSESHDESFLMLIDRNGKWRISTMLKGFAARVQGFASSFSNTGDIILIGKDKRDMMHAFQRMKEIGGGIALSENQEILHEIPLTVGGIMSDKKMEELIEEEKKMKELLFSRGYSFNDPVYTLLFLQSTHLPYIRVTQRGIYDVMKKTVLFPTIMR
ncbi:adenine deaminase [Bacillus salacetis]|uniref:adenine deaminase n=1 Tax=Bacillus salacetis TaxID=2315464 RepID=A0A3A1QY86_9BACI|nr:adenine deaminase C-terminal domain-containing protein [Bacillus salacetis]RIW33957.1 adenine deaminase [Bacillus salacetis]